MRTNSSKNPFLSAARRLSLWIVPALLLVSEVSAQRILYPKPDQARVPRSGKDLVGEDIPGVLFEMKVHESSPTGKVVASRTQAASPILSMDGLKADQVYYGSIRILGRQNRSTVRFYTGDLPDFSASVPPHVNMIEGEPVELTASTRGAVDSVRWEDSLGRVRSSNNTLSLPTDPNVAGIYTLVVNGPGRTDRLPVWFRWMAPPTITGLPERLAVNVGQPASLTGQVGGLDVSAEWVWTSLDDPERAPVVVPTSDGVLPIAPADSEGRWSAELVASNEAGTASHTVEVEFGAPPRLGGPPVPAEGRAGAELSIHPEWIGNLPERTLWTRPDGLELPWVEGGGLELPVLESVHDGVWTVRAENEFGATVAQVPVRVLATTPPEPLVLRIRPTTGGVEISWPEGYEVRDEAGFHQLQSSLDLETWWSLSLEEFEPVLRGGRWTVEIPNYADEEAVEAFRILPWVESDLMLKP